MRRFFVVTALLVAVFGVFALSDSASATNPILDDFTLAYPATAGTALDSCSTCHTSVPALNAYGSAVRSSGFNFSGIENLDSDGDGFTNLEETRALTNPGDPLSNPTTTSTTTTNATADPSPTSTSTTTTSTAQPAPLVASPAAAGRSGAAAIDAGPVGTVWLAIEDGRLVVTEVVTTWRFTIEEETDDEGDSKIEVNFRSGEMEVEFEAELEHGTIKTKIEVETEDDSDNEEGDHHDDDDHEGEHDDHDGDGDDHKTRHDDDDDAGDDHDD
jgi:hypothetical protein